MATTLTPAPRTRGVPFFVPLLNPLIALLVRMGLPIAPGGAPMVLLTIAGRKTARLRTTPVNAFHHDGRRYVFGTFGETSWVKNLRAARQAELTEAGRHFAVDALLLDPEHAGPILSLALVPMLKVPVLSLALRFFYGIGPGATADDFIAEARRHPVFELRERPTAG